HPVLPNCDDSATKDLLIEHGWAETTVAREQLYDLALDPEEGRNLATAWEHAHVASSLRDRLLRWMRDTDDPLLSGPVPAPRGSLVNYQPQRSPSEPTRKVTT